MFLTSTQKAKSYDATQRAKDRAADTKRIKDLERQVREMEQIVRKRNPNRYSAAYWLLPLWLNMDSFFYLFASSPPDKCGFDCWVKSCCPGLWYFISNTFYLNHCSFCSSKTWPSSLTPINEINWYVIVLEVILSLILNGELCNHHSAARTAEDSSHKAIQYASPFFSYH